MTDEMRPADEDTLTEAGRQTLSATPAAAEGSRVAPFAALLVILVLVVAGGVWWYVTRGSAAAERAAAERIQQLGAFVHPLRDGEHVNTVNVLSFASADANLENLELVIQEIPALRHMQIFNATNAPVTDEHLQTVGSLDSLIQVILTNERGDSQVTDAGIAHLANLDNLHSLNIYGTNITRKGLESVGELESLKVLDIGKTKVSGDFSELLPLKNLEWLLASDLELSDEVVDTLAKLPKITHLTFGGSTLSDEARSRLRDEKRGITID